MASAAFHFDAQSSLAKVSVASAGTTTATLDSTTGIYTTEWSIVATDDTTVVGDWSLSTTTGSSTVVTVPSGRGLSALLQCKVNGGSVQDPRTGQLVQGDYIKTAKIYVAPEVIALGETNESDATDYYIALVNNVIRSLTTSGTLYSSSDVFTLTGPGSTIGVTTSAEALTVQPGQSGSGVGKDMTWGGGAGATPGTNLAGAAKCELGQTVGGITAEMQWLSNGTRIGGVKVDAGGRLYMSNAASISSSGLYLEASTGYLALRGTTLANVESGADLYLTIGTGYSVYKFFQTASAAGTIREKHATGTTSDATPTNFGTLPITDDRAFHVTAIVTAYKDNATVATFERKATFRAAAGTATKVGSSTLVHSAADAALATAAIELVHSGGNATVQCTGVAATALRWEVYLAGSVGRG